MGNLLEVKSLSITFEGNQAREKVVRNVSFSVMEGEILGIAGESGSGKTLTALAIAGLLNRHGAVSLEGEILFQGKNLLTCKREELRRYQGNDISMVFQEPMSSLNPVMKIGRQIEESIKIHGTLSKKERKEKAIWAMECVELENPEKIYHRYPHELSGGMRQRVMIAASLISNPRLMIADEPTTALDVSIQHQILKLFQKINRENHTAILFISHDLSLIYHLCGRALVMYEGSLIEEGNTKEIFYHPRHSYTKNLIACIPTYEKKV